MENKDIKVIFMGTPEFAVPPLEALINADYGVALVVTNPDKPIGRKKITTPPPVKVAAKSAGWRSGIAVFQPKSVKDPAAIEEIKKIAPDLIIICAYGKIIPKEILDIPRLGTINIHASLLPRWRGPSPIQYAILNGDKETGITIMAVNEKMDEGGVYSQETIPIEKTDDAETLSEKLSALGADLLIKTLPKIISGELKSRPQEEFVEIWGAVSYCKMLKKEDGKINWNEPAEKIERQIRAFVKEPGSFFSWKQGGVNLSPFRNSPAERSPFGRSPIGGEIKLLQAAAIPCPDKTALKNGETFLIGKNGAGVKTGGGCLEILKLQPAGKNPMQTKNFLNGYPDFIGTILD